MINIEKSPAIIEYNKTNEYKISFFKRIDILTIN